MTPRKRHPGNLQAPPTPIFSARAEKHVVVTVQRAQSGEMFPVTKILTPDEAQAFAEQLAAAAVAAR